MMARSSNVVLFEPRRQKEIEEQEASDRSQSYESEISLQLDNLQRIADVEREKVLKKNWIADVEMLYNLADLQNPFPSYRPRIQIPELQIDLLQEANDLSDVNPIPYIVRSGKDEREKQLEKGFVANWRQSNYNIQVLKSSLWSLLAGNGYSQVVLDRYAYGGRGKIRVVGRHPGSVFRDPFSMEDEDIRFVVFQDMVYLDDIRRMWPENGYRVRYHRAGGASTMDWRLSMPSGPMSMMGGVLGGANSDRVSGGMDESRVRLRTAFIRDYSSKEGDNENIPKNMPIPRRRMMYPNGRMIIECEGITLFDGDNPAPDGEFPLVTWWGMPPLTSAQAPSPAKFSRGLQELAERMYTQIYENAVRLNNGTTYIEESTGIDIEDFGGAPAEVHMIAAGSKAPETKWPSAMPAHMLEMPDKLLDKQKLIQGMSPARKGTVTAGNTSAPLYDSAMINSTSLTRMRGKFFSVSFQRLARLVFAYMGRFIKDERTFPAFVDEKYQPTKWEPINGFKMDDYMIQLDEASIQPYSQTALRSLVPVLKQLGILPAEFALEMLNVPNKEAILEALAKEAQQKSQAEASKTAAKAATRGRK
jgi:hypothetical protein